MRAIHGRPWHLQHVASCNLLRRGGCEGGGGVRGVFYSKLRISIRKWLIILVLHVG